MKLDIVHEKVWVATIADKPGGLREKLAALADAGANLGFMIARRSERKPGEGVVFLTPLEGARQTKAAEAVGFRPSTSLHGVRVSGPDKPGASAMLTGVLADAGLNLRGLSAAAIDKKMVMHLAFDSEADAKAAIAALKKLAG